MPRAVKSAYDYKPSDGPSFKSLVNSYNLLFLGSLFLILQSDSGGPLTYKQGDQHVLIGDVSGGLGAGDTHFYARISFLREWIDTQLVGANYCPNGGPDSRS